MTAGTDILLWLQEIRISAPVFVTDVFNALSSPYVYWVLPVAVAGVLLWGVDKRKGERLMFGFFFAMSFAVLLKGVLCVPRPWQADPRVIPDPTAMKGAGGLSCPSGHTVSAVSAFGSLAAFLGRWWVWAACGALLALVPFSRMWLGVHTPLDLAVGAVAAVCVAVAAGKALEWAENGEGRDTVLLVVSSAIFAALFASMYLLPTSFSGGSPHTTPEAGLAVVCGYCGFVYGMLFSWYAERRLVGRTVGGTAAERAVRCAVGVPVCCALLLGPIYGLSALGFSNEGNVISGIASMGFLFLVYPWILERRWPVSRTP